MSQEDKGRKKARINARMKPGEILRDKVIGKGIIDPKQSKDSRRGRAAPRAARATATFV